MKRILALVMVMALLIGVSSAALGQNLAGALGGNLGPGNYYVVGNIVLPPDSVLTIAPGTIITAMGNYGFDVFGKIIAIGTQTDSIKFINGGVSAWNGINIDSLSSDSSRFEYCVFEGSNCIGVDVEGCGPTFYNCLFTNCNSGGG